MAKSTVRVRGYREFMRAARKSEKSTRDVIKARLSKAAEPVRDEAKRDFERYDKRSASGFKTRVWGRGYGVFVEQSRRRTTGHHPEFGTLQMATLFRALDKKSGEVERELEKGVDELADILD